MPVSYDDLIPKKKTGYDDLIPTSTSGDVVKSAAAAIPKGVAGAYGLPGDLVDALTSFGEFGAAKIGGLFGIPEERFYGMGKPEVPLPTSDRLRSAVSQVVPYQPKTETGRRVGGVVESLSGAMSLGGKAQAIPGLLSGVGAETGGILSGDNQWVRAAGALGFPLAGAGVSAYRATPGQMVRESTGGMTPEQFALAKARIEQARQQGISLTAPEALPPSGIQQLASDVAASQSGGRVINQFMEQRPAQIQQAVESNLLNRVGGAGTPDANMARARDAATNVISGAEKARSAAVKPMYEAAKADVIADPARAAIVQSIDDALPNLSPESRAAAIKFKQTLRATPDNAAALDDLYKTTRNRIDLPSIGATPEQKTAAGVLGPFNSQLGSALESGSPNIAAGRQAYRDITENVVNPLTAGPVGRVAGKQGFEPGSPESLNPISAISNERVARPESIRELYTHLNKQDPQAFPGMVRTWLENAFDAAQQTVQAGKNRMSGANFAKAVYGTPQQEANFLETMRGVAVANGKNPDDFAKGAKNLMDVLQLTGKVPGIGSPTGGRIAANEMAASSGAASVAESISAAPLSSVARKLRQWSMQGNYKQLAEVMTSPDSIDKIIAMGKYKPSTTTAQYFAAGALGLINESDQ